MATRQTPVLFKLTITVTKIENYLSKMLLIRIPDNCNNMIGLLHETNSVSFYSNALNILAACFSILCNFIRVNQRYYVKKK